MKPVSRISALQPLIELTHHRWNIPALAELARTNGAKFVTLAKALGASRSSLSASLSDLIDQGLVMKNPGYGHPMRPEYLLTERGKSIAHHCLDLAVLMRRRGDGDFAYRKWTLPLVAAIGEDVRRFNEVRGALGEDVTPRAVTLGLKSMLSRGWARRLLIDDYPPAAGYALMPKGRNVLSRVEALC